MSKALPLLPLVWITICISLSMAPRSQYSAREMIKLSNFIDSIRLVYTSTAMLICEMCLGTDRKDI